MLATLQKFLYHFLLDAGISGVYNEIYSSVPERPPFPHIRIGDMSVEPYYTNKKRGMKAKAVIEVYSLHYGNSECLNIMQEILDAIRRADSHFIRRHYEINIEWMNAVRMDVSENVKQKSRCWAGKIALAFIATE